MVESLISFWKTCTYSNVSIQNSSNAKEGKKIKKFSLEVVKLVVPDRLTTGNLFPPLLHCGSRTGNWFSPTLLHLGSHSLESVLGAFSVLCRVLRL